jgi:environmental stress-induced protein Ves
MRNFGAMSSAKQNLKNIDQRLKEIDRQINALAKEKMRLTVARGDPHLVFEPAGDVATHGRNIAKLQTLGRVRTILREFGHPLSTSGLMTLLKERAAGGFNAVTIRSHLRRLKLEGHLMFDEKSKVWKLSEKQAEKKE